MFFIEFYCFDIEFHMFYRCVFLFMYIDFWIFYFITIDTYYSNKPTIGSIELIVLSISQIGEISLVGSSEQIQINFKMSRFESFN